MNRIYKLLAYIVISGNILFFLWIVYNGVNEGFRGTLIQIVSYIGLLLLLILNTVMLLKKSKR